MIIKFTNGTTTANFNANLVCKSKEAALDEWTDYIITEDSVPDILRNILWLNFEREHNVDYCANISLEYRIVFDEDGDSWLAAKSDDKETQMQVILTADELKALKSFGICSETEG